MLENYKAKETIRSRAHPGAHLGINSTKGVKQAHPDGQIKQAKKLGIVERTHQDAYITGRPRWTQGEGLGRGHNWRRAAGRARTSNVDVVVDFNNMMGRMAGVLQERERNLKPAQVHQWARGRHERGLAPL